jgi:hypothetical protein
MGHQPSQKYMTTPVTAVTIKRGGSMYLNADAITGFSMTVVTTGNLVGAFKFYSSDDPRARQDAPQDVQFAAKWNEFTTAVAAQIVNPAGAPTNFQVQVSDFRAGFMRMDFEATAGTGTVESWYSGVGGA